MVIVFLQIEWGNPKNLNTLAAFLRIYLKESRNSNNIFE